jgi:ParB-like chromosome segregation protein Spo0J
MPDKTLEKRNPSKLTNHPLNASIYGDKPDDEFVELVRENGIDQPIRILTSNIVISGHRRLQAAIAIGMKEVPVIVDHVLSDASKLAIEKSLIVANKQRDKTTEQRAREFDALERIEKALAKKRQRNAGGVKQHSGEALKVNLPEALDTPKKTGQAREIAAAEVGWSGRTAKAASDVVSEIDKAEESGDTERAEDLRETLNTKSVRAAKKKVSPKNPKRAKKKSVEKLYDRSYWFKQWEQSIGPLCRLVDKIAENVGDADSELHTLVQDHLNDATDAMAEWMEVRS